MANGVTFGVNFPFRQSDVGDYVLLTDTTSEEIRSNLLHLILTRKGSRYYLPDFGTRIYEFIFEPLDGETFSQIKADIEDQVEKYVPNVTINNITIEPYFEIDETLSDSTLDLSSESTIYRIPGPNTQEYTAKLKIEYTDDSKGFGSREFIIINI